MQLDINTIRIGKRLRDVDLRNPEYQALLEDIKVNGLIQPIVLYRLGTSAPRLVAGLHRLTALKTLGTQELVQGVHFKLLDTDGMTPRMVVAHSRVVEAAENLRRVGLTPRQRKLFIVQQERACALVVMQRKQADQPQLESHKLAADKKAADARAAMKRKPNPSNADEIERTEALRKLAEQKLRRHKDTVASLKTVAFDRIDAKISTEVRDAVVRLTGLSRSELSNVSYATRNLYGFVKPEELHGNRICKLIDETPGEYTILESLAQPSAKAYHAGLTDWCNRIREGKSVEAPSQLKEKIKNQHSEAAKLEAQRDEHKAKRTMVEYVSQLHSDVTRTIQKMQTHAREVGHESVVHLFKSEQVHLEKARQLLSEIKDRTYQRTA